MDKEIGRFLHFHRKRHIFSRFRYHLRYLIAPFFVIFGVADYFYRPDLFASWMVLRFIFLGYVWLAFEALKVKKIRDRYSEWFAVSALVAACLVINWMIWQTGGHKSLYITGLILVSVTGLQILRLESSMALICNFLCYAPTTAIILFTSWNDDLKTGLVQSFFLFGMVLLAHIFRSSEDMAAKIWTSMKVNQERELARLRRTEFLSKTFPLELRLMIEEGKEKLPDKRLHQTAVVGFADVTGSTALTNSVGLLKDWEIKQRFLEVATKRATQCGLIVLTQLGDGFMFLANYRDSSDWTLNVVSFFEGILRDFEQIKNELVKDIGNIETGVKCSLSMGPAIIGFIGSDQSYYTAMGPDVNLAARLCAKSGNNELIVSSRVWHVLKHTLAGWDVRDQRYADLKGFSYEVPAVHISPRTSHKNIQQCTECRAPLSVVRTDEGFIDIRCPNGHKLDPSALNKTLRAAG